MGKRLLQIYDEAKKIGGLSAQIKLAILTKMPSSEAENSPDSIENIGLFQKCMEKIRMEYMNLNVK
jgi:hypothetical protein